MQCGCKRHSIDARQLEDDFRRLVQLLTIKPEAQHLMLEMAMQVNKDVEDTKDLERQKQAAIALLKQQLLNLLDLYKNAVITAEEYYRDKADRERQISFGKRERAIYRKRRLSLSAC